MSHPAVANLAPARHAQVADGDAMSAPAGTVKNTAPSPGRCYPEARFFLRSMERTRAISRAGSRSVTEQSVDGVEIEDLAQLGIGALGEHLGRRAQGDQEAAWATVVPTLSRRTPADANSATVGAPGQAITLTGSGDAWTSAAMAARSTRPGRNRQWSEAASW
jgi:hypothetical protein